MHRPAKVRLSLSVPTIPNITGTSVEEFVFDNTTNPIAATLTLSSG